jgi:hypothetical protein
MNRKLFPLCGVLIAVLSFTFGGSDAEARNRCGRQRNNCCQKYNNQGWQQAGFVGNTWGRNNGNCCGQYGNNGNYNNYGSQQTAYYGSRPMNNNCCQQASYSSCQPTCGMVNASVCCASATSANWNSSNGAYNAQPNMIPATSTNAVQPPVEIAPPDETKAPVAPKPAA